MSAISLSGLRCTSASLVIPRHGAWSGDVELATAGAIPTGKGEAVFELGALRRKCTVYRYAAHGGSIRARIVGGRGGWRGVIPARGYSHAFGVKRSNVIKDAAREAGEEVVVGADAVIGQFYNRVEAKAERVLRRLAGGVWWMDDDGVTQVSARPQSRVTSAYTVSERDGGRGSFEIATEAFQDWFPGKLFSSPTAPDEQEANTVLIRSGEGGVARVTVLTGESDRDRLLGDVRAIVQAETAELLYSRLWEYTVDSATNKTVDAFPTDRRMPEIVDCPMLPGLVGGEVTPASGSKCYVMFINADPAQPRVVHLDGVPTLTDLMAGGMVGGEHLMTVEACVTLIFNVFVSLTIFNQGSIPPGPGMQQFIMPAVLAALTAQGAPAPPGLVSQLSTAPGLASAAVSGSTMINTSAPFTALIEALALKTPNESNFFPSLGAKALKGG